MITEAERNKLWKCKVYIESRVTQVSLKIPAHKLLAAWNRPDTVYLIHPPESTTFPPFDREQRLRYI